MLGAIALAGWQPWATSSVTPNLSLAPGLGVALGDSNAVARAGSPGVGTGGIAAPTPTTKVSAPVTVPGAGSKHHAPDPVLAVSQARSLQVASAPVPASSPPAHKPSPSPAPVVVTPAPAPAPAAAPAPPLVAAVENGKPGTAGRPSTSVVGGGGPELSCEGDEYLLTLSFEEAEAEGEEVDYELAEVDILMQRFGADGSEDELQLEGNLADLRSLVGTLVAEGNCVRVVVVPREDGEPVPEAAEIELDGVEATDLEAYGVEATELEVDGVEVGETFEPVVP